MFEILRKVSDGVSTKSIYRATLELYRRRRLGNWRDDQDIDDYPDGAGPPEAATASVSQVTGYVLGEIERVEGKPLRDLSEDTAGRYITRLSGILMDRIVNSPGFNPERGKAALEELRRDYGPGYRHNAAA